MQNVSNEYKNQINTSYSLSPKCKIKIGNVEYLGNVIKTFPKIKHSNTKIIGGFPAKTCSFEIYDLENSLTLENKEIEVYKGIVIGDTTEWIKQGVFIPKPQNIKTNISSRTISLENVQDKTQLFDTAYVTSLNWDDNQTHSGLEIVQEICSKIGVTLITTSFAWANYYFKQPNFKTNISNREVVSRIAEIGGEIALLNCDGNLKIISQNVVDGDFDAHRYGKLAKEKLYSINSISLGKDGVDDDILYPTELNETRTTWKINDNPFVDLYREEMIELVADKIIGISYTPYSIENFVDGYLYELNDVLSIKDKKGNSFQAVILDYESLNRIKSTIKASVVDADRINYDLAGSNKETMNQVKQEVDHIKNEIRSTVESIEIIEMQTKELEQETNNNFLEIIEKFDGYVPTSDLVQLEQKVQTIQTDTYTKTEINTKLIDGSVKKVLTTSGTFDENGMHYEKSNAPTSSTINHLGVNVKSAENNQSLLFAGYDEELNESIVKTENLTVNKYFVCGNSRIENYGTGGGMFVL